ncbi:MULTISPECIES: LLM class F420-dependent oxidoreductase [Frankia]|uniref:LLM class F420-dependent oxidoreductase n=1 Tax=Frankia TaxID=1854 RepID=UPI000311CA6D|nr:MULTISPECIES: LLM class F420-dependent oxidoreductase [Frankia]
MKVDVGLWADLDDIASRSRELESLGYDALYVPETAHDPFLPVVLAAQATERVMIRTGVAVAFPRSPMHLAMVANDLHTISRGRFVLGLGSQVKPHIEKRFSAVWSEPAKRMREIVLAIQAIWRCWNDGERLDFQGEFYQHTLMTPFFNPGPNPYGTPRIQLAALGPRMTEVAGEVSDGILLHGLSSERFVREVTLPALERGLARAGRKRSDVELTFPTLIATGDTDEELAESEKKLRQHFAFYASTPAYSAVLELHGWGGLQRDLYELTRDGRWQDLGSLVTEEVLEVFTARGTPEDIPKQIRARVGDIADRVSFYSPAPITPEVISRILAGLKG